MMEALAIGLAALSIGLAIKAWWNLRECQRHLERMDALLAYRRSLLTPFDHDGDGKPGGSKPRGKG